MAATRQELEHVIREQLGRVAENTQLAGLPSRGMFNRATEAILKAADGYATHAAAEVLKPIPAEAGE